MVIPKKVQIGPFVFTVRLDQFSKTVLTDSHGELDVDLLEIRLHPDRAELIIKETLLHEIIHGVCAVGGLDHELGADQEEKIVRRLAPILLDVLRRNPGMVEYLCGNNSAK